MDLKEKLEKIANKFNAEITFTKRGVYFQFNEKVIDENVEKTSLFDDVDTEVMDLDDSFFGGIAENIFGDVSDTTIFYNVFE